MPSHLDSPGFSGQERYEKYLLETRRVSEKRARDNVSLLNTVARIVNCRLTPDMVAMKSQIESIVKKLLANGLANDSVNDCKTVFRHYCRALNKTGPR